MREVSFKSVSQSVVRPSVSLSVRHTFLQICRIRFCDVMYFSSRITLPSGLVVIVINNLRNNSRFQKLNQTSYFLHISPKILTVFFFCHPFLRTRKYHEDNYRIFSHIWLQIDAYVAESKNQVNNMQSRRWFNALVSENDELKSYIFIFSNSIEEKFVTKYAWKLSLGP